MPTVARIRNDYKPAGSETRRLPGRALSLFALGLGLPLLGLAFLPEGISQRESSGTDLFLSELSVTGSDQEKLAELSVLGERLGVVPPLLPVTYGDRLELTVRSGDSLDRIFLRNGISRTDLGNLLTNETARKNLRILRPGDHITIIHEAGQLLGLARDLDMTNTLVVLNGDDGYDARIHQQTLERRQRVASGRIDSSLFLAATDAGISDRTIMNLAGIFAWDVDFVLDIRSGDEFVVVYEELWKDGAPVGEGEILAAEFVNQGDAYRAIRYTDPTGRTSYYNPEGKSMRKAFVRAPLAFSRVSSPFNLRRRHPVLNSIRAHRGVDYAAPRGTPVKAAGDGKVIFRGRKGGYGNVVVIQHGSNISTLYAHLNNFARSVPHGARVKQGQTIGFVGSTGLATGPHLHYEFKVNGVHRNPRTVKLPEAAPVPEQYRLDFDSSVEPLIQRLNKHRGWLADNAEESQTRT